MKKEDDALVTFIEVDEELTPDNSTAIPNDFVDKYIHIFKKNEQILAVLDLIRQSYLIGLKLGKEQKIKEYEESLDKIYK